MAVFFLYLFVFIAAVLEASLLPLQWEMMILVVWILAGPPIEEDNLVFPFLLGLIFDLVLARPLGLTSLIFMAVAFFLGIYTKKLDLSKRYFLVIFLPVASFLFSQIMGSNFSIEQAILEIILAWLIWPVIKYFFEEREDGKQLKLRI